MGAKILHILGLTACVRELRCDTIVEDTITVELFDNYTGTALEHCFTDCEYDVDIDFKQNYGINKESWQSLNRGVLSKKQRRKL